MQQTYKTQDQDDAKHISSQLRRTNNTITFELDDHSSYKYLSCHVRFFYGNYSTAYDINMILKSEGMFGALYKTFALY